MDSMRQMPGNETMIIDQVALVVDVVNISKKARKKSKRQGNPVKTLWKRWRFNHRQEKSSKGTTWKIQGIKGTYPHYSHSPLSMDRV